MAQIINSKRIVRENRFPYTKTYLDTTEADGVEVAAAADAAGPVSLAAAAVSEDPSIAVDEDG